MTRHEGWRRVSTSPEKNRRGEPPRAPDYSDVGLFLQHVADRESALWTRFHENLAAAAEAMAAARKEPVVTGSTGQLVEHPGFKTAARADELALKLYRELTEGQIEAAAGVIASMSDAPIRAAA